MRWIHVTRCTEKQHKGFHQAYELVNSPKAS